MEHIGLLTVDDSMWNRRHFHSSKSILMNIMRAEFHLLLQLQASGSVRDGLRTLFIPLKCLWRPKENLSADIVKLQLTRRMTDIIIYECFKWFHARKPLVDVCVCGSGDREDTEGKTSTMTFISHCLSWKNADKRQMNCSRLGNYMSGREEKIKKRTKKQNSNSDFPGIYTKH